MSVSAADAVVGKLLLCTVRVRSPSGTQAFAASCGLCPVLSVHDHGGLPSPSLGLGVAQWQRLAWHAPGPGSIPALQKDKKEVMRLPL